MTYAFYMEAEEARFARFERILGTTWTYSDVAGMRGDEQAEAEVRVLPQDQRLFFPLMLGLNPNIVKEVKSRFGVNTLHAAFGDEGFDENTESLFHMPKEKFLARVSSGSKKAGIDNEYDVAPEAINTKRGRR